MKANPNSNPKPSFQSLALFVLVFAAGIALAGIWFHNHHPRSSTDQLSDSTKTVLSQLTTPVTIHYYALLPAGSADETLQAFAGRVAQLLTAMQTASGGKLQLSSVHTPADAGITAASAAGIQPFNLDKGDACFLGLVITSGKNTEAFARLAPEWEPALEFDLARAIQRVAAAAPVPPVPEVAKPSPETIATINRLIPDVSVVSAEQADQLFQAEFLKQCGEAGAEMEAKIKAAQQQAVQAQGSGSPADQEAAQKKLLQAQMERAEKFKDLAAQLQVQQAVFRRMKTNNTNAAK